MDDLDFSTLTDDQLVGLVRAALRECVARGDVVTAAARDAGLDEAERARVAKDAAEREAAKMRARERERVAREAAEQVRAAREAQEAAAKAAESEARRAREETEAIARRRREQEEARREAEAAVRKAEERDAARKAWLRRVADLVGLAPGEVLICRAKTRHGWRVLVNEGNDRYSNTHLVDYYPESASIHTTRALLKRKRDLVSLCAEFWALNPKEETVYRGDQYLWEEAESA